MKTGVIIVDDHPMVRQGLRQLLQQQAEFECLGDAPDAESAKVLLAETKPKIVLLDISMPKKDGISFAKELKILHPGLSIIFLSMHEESEFIQRAFAAGARGYLLKSSDSDEVLKALREVVKGNRYVSAEVSLRFLESDEEVADPKAKGAVKVTDREKEILSLVAQGLSAKEIANTTGISYRTVEVHKQNIMKKLGAKNAVELVRLATACGLIEE